MSPFARTSDPLTSHEAAASVKTSTVKLLRESIVRVLNSYYPLGLTDEELYAEVDVMLTFDGTEVFVSESSLRTRRRELVDLGTVEAVPDQKGWTDAGRPCHLWRLTKEMRLF